MGQFFRNHYTERCCQESKNCQGEKDDVSGSWQKKREALGSIWNAETEEANPTDNEGNG
jgi:hypothetical protein